MAVGILTPQDCLKDDPSLGTLILSSMERHGNPNPDRSPRRKRSTRKFQRNVKCDNRTLHGKQRRTMVLAPTRILKRGEVLDDDERTGVDLNESEKKEHHQRDHSSKQIPYSNSNVVSEFYAGLAVVDSPHPSSVPLPTFLGPKRSLAPDLQMD